MSGAMNRHCIPDLIITTALTGTSLVECPGIIKTMHTGFSVHVLVLKANAPVLTRKKPDAFMQDLCRSDAQ